MAFLFVFLLTIFCLGTALVLGGTAAVAFAAAPQLHKTLEARQAGRAFQRVLHVFDRMGFGGAWAAVLSAAFLGVLSRAPHPRWWIETAIMALAALGYLFLILSLAPRAKKLAPEEGADARSDFEKAEFQRLHRIYVRIYATNLVLATAAFVVLALPL